LSRPYHVLRHRDFRLLWLSQLVSLTGSQMQTVALHWHVYLLTRSPLALGALGLTRVLPIILFSLGGGVTADRYDRRRVMFLTQSAMLAGSALLAVLTARGGESLALLYGANALLAAVTAFDNPARQALIPRLVPVRELPAALSLNLTMFHAAFIGGPALAGLVIAGVGLPPGGLHLLAGAGASESTSRLALIYGLNALSFVAGFCRRVRAGHDRLRPLARVLADVPCPRARRARRPRLDGDPPDPAPDADARRAARPHDVGEHDLLHGRSAAGRAGSRRPGLAVRLRGRRCHRGPWSPAASRRSSGRQRRPSGPGGPRLRAAGRRAEELRRSPPVTPATFYTVRSPACWRAVRSRRGQSMDLGAFSISLAVKDLEASRALAPAQG